MTPNVNYHLLSRLKSKLARWYSQLIKTRGNHDDRNSNCLTRSHVEWYLHKYALHGVPKEGGGRKSLSEAFMKRHWAHHKRVRLTKYRDDELYADFSESPDAKAEAAALIKICAVTSLAMPVAPFFTLTTYYCAWNYWHVHSQSHLDPEWGKKKIP